MTHTITAALASSARREDDMLRRDFLKTATATAVLTATLPVQAKETPAMSNANFAEARNGPNSPSRPSTNRRRGRALNERIVKNDILWHRHRRRSH